MGFSFLPFGQGSGEKLRSKIVDTDKHIGYVNIDVGDENNTVPAVGKLPTGELGTDDFATQQVTVTTTATQIVAANTKRRGVLIVNEGTTDVRIGKSTVTAATGVLLLGQKGAGMYIDTRAAVYGRTSTVSQSVSYIEVFDL